MLHLVQRGSTRKRTDENLDLDFNSLDAQREAGKVSFFPGLAHRAG